jgi:uncharacterized membrane protein (UPF0127 family)
MAHNAWPASFHLTRRMKALFIRLLGLCWLASTAAWSQEGPQLDLPRTTLSAGMHLIHAQVAATPSSRTVGLMHRQDMPANEGMLFVFEQPATQCFWMKNTLLPLTAAFVADDGTIVNLADMQPQSLDSHCSARPVRYVLEMHQGWFAKRGIKAGTRLSSPSFGK